MAIIVSGNTVINDSRELSNIADTSGTYSNFQPLQIAATNVTGDYSINMNNPLYVLTLSGNSTLGCNTLDAGHSTTVIVDRSINLRSLSFNTIIKWGNGTSPLIQTGDPFRYWLITLTAYNGTSVFGNAVGTDL